MLHDANWFLWVLSHVICNLCDEVGKLINFAYFIYSCCCLINLKNVNLRQFATKMGFLMKIHLKKLLAATLLCSAANVVYGEGNSKLSPYTNIFLEMNKQGVIEADGSLKSVMPVVGDVTVKSKALQMQQSRPFTKIVNVNGVQMVESCVVLADGATAADIEAAGAIVVTDIGSVVVAQIPIDAIEQIGELGSVERIEIARPVKMLNDKAREATRVDMVHAGAGLSSPMTGKGVLVGVVDGGIDFNHIAFKDDEGNTRIVKAYVGNNSGTTYDDPASIGALTTDSRNDFHGTHTSGTAAGSDVGNGLQGMAPEADLYLCGLGDNMMQSDIINQTKAIIDYAAQNNQPAVVNLSLGNNTGTHDGTGAAKAISDLTGEGAIVVVAAGNEGDVDLYVHKEFENASADEVQCQTIIDGSPYMGESYPGYYYAMIDCYTSQPTQLQFVVVDTNSGNNVVLESDIVDIGEYNYVTISSLFENNALNRYFTVQYDSYNYIYAMRNSNGKYEAMVNLLMSPGSSNFSQRYLLAMRFYGQQGNELDMWSDAYCEFTDNGDAAYTAGSSDGSYNDLATGENLISVGAYTTKTRWYPINEDGDRFTDNDGNDLYMYYREATEGTMASFSSYGTDLNGVQHPTIVAPGYGVSSAYNRYNLNVQTYGYTYNNGYFTNQVERDGETYIYCMNQGTSMACPVVTGIIATWLECDPTLTPADIKEIFAATAQKPDAFGTGIPEQWGPNGLIDAYAGLVYLGNTGVNDVTKKQDMVLVGPNPTDGQFKVYAQGEDEVTLSIYSMGGAQVFAKRYVTDNGSIDVDLEGSLSAGIYVLQVRGNKCNYSGKLIVK